MPNIREYQAPALGLQPSSVGTEAAAAAGRRIGGFYNQAGQAQADTGQRVAGVVRDAGDAALQHIDHEDIRAIAKNGTQAGANLDDSWNKVVTGWTDPDGTVHPPADPNDTSVKEKWRAEVLEPTLEKFQASALTEKSQQFALQMADKYREHFFVKTSADMVALSKRATGQAVDGTINNLTGMTYADPSSLETNVGMLKHTMDGIIGSSGLKGADAVAVSGDYNQRGMRELVHAAVSGTIAKGGDYQKIINDPRFSPYVNRQEVETFARAQKVQQRTELLQQKQIDAYAKAQNVTAAEAALSKNWTDSVSFDANGKATIKPDFFSNNLNIERRYPGAATERTRAMINWGQSEQRERHEVITTDPAVQKDLMDGLFRTEKPTTDVDILRAATENKLDQHATSTLLQLHKALEDTPLKGPIYHDTMEAVKGTLGTDPIGHEAYGKFVQSFIPDYIRQMRAGTLPPNALDTRDPNSLISKAMAPYRRDPSQMFADRISHGLMAPGEIGSLDNLLPGNARTPKAAAAPKISTKADYDVLKSGATFVGDDGKTYRKP